MRAVNHNSERKNLLKNDAVDLVIDMNRNVVSVLKNEDVFAYKKLSRRLEKIIRSVIMNYTHCYIVKLFIGTSYDDTVGEFNIINCNGELELSRALDDLTSERFRTHKYVYIATIFNITNDHIIST